MYSIVVFMKKMFLLDGSIVLGEIVFLFCPRGSGVKFSIPETPGVKVCGRGWLPYSYYTG